MYSTQSLPRSIDPICQRMAQHFSNRPGNYLAFFSSYAYLQQVLDAFRQRYPHIVTVEQSAGMSESKRAGFLARFTEHSNQIGFCVLGGAFGEGIDLPGERLVGAFITTLGLPAKTPVNEEISVECNNDLVESMTMPISIPDCRK